MELTKETPTCRLTCAAYRSAGEVPLAIVIVLATAFALGLFTLT